jgi:hypothetical protein
MGSSRCERATFRGVAILDPRDFLALLSPLDPN